MRSQSGVASSSAPADGAAPRSPPPLVGNYRHTRSLIAQAIAAALHELATNAAKYGALAPLKKAKLILLRHYFCLTLFVSDWFLLARHRADLAVACLNLIFPHLKFGPRSQGSSAFAAGQVKRQVKPEGA